MDKRTQEALDLINQHTKIKKYLIAISYFFILIGMFSYLFYATKENKKNIKFITNYEKYPEKYKIEKVMTNPSMNFQHNDNKIYKIKAKSASHINNQEVNLYDVFASGEIGNITAGKLIIDEGGDHLVFSDNPVLILNKTQK
jgi:hypothetical protein